MASEETKIDFDLMADKTFIHYESAYRNQEIVLRRSTEKSRLTLGEVLKKLFNENVSTIKSMAIAYRQAEFGSDVNESLISDKSAIWNFDLFSCILKTKVDGHYTMGMFHETTLIVNCSSRRYIMTLTSLGGIDTIKYMRVSLSSPDNKTIDDGMSLKTENAPISISFILSYSEIEDNAEYAKFENIEKIVSNKQAKEQELDELETEYVHGQFEFQGYYYINYGRWLFEQNRYYDAFSILERAFNYIRMNLDDRNKETISVYYDICNIMGHCLSQMDREDEAAYYFKQGAPGVSLDKPNYLALCYAKLGNSTAISRMQEWLHLVTQKYGEHENWSEDVKQFFTDLPIELVKYKKQADELLRISSHYDNTITIGIILKTLMGLNKKNIAPCMFVYNAINNKFDEKIEDIDAIINYAINNPENKDKIFVLSCTHTYYKMNENKDKSILCFNAPLIISTHSIKGDKTSAIMRVDITRCNFANNDDKTEPTKMNFPISFTICLGTYQELCYGIDNNRLLAAIRKAIEFVDERRYFEAYNLAKWVFECASNRLKSKMGLEYESEDNLLWGIFYEASYRIGFCLMEMHKMTTSAYYLELASNSMQDTHVQEYINLLANTNDSQALSVIEYVLVNSHKPESIENLNAWNYHIAFLKRRKAYILIDEKRLEEAKTYITEEILNDPLCKEFAESELNYIRELERRN